VFRTVALAGISGDAYTHGRPNKGGSAAAARVAVVKVRPRVHDGGGGGNG